VSTVLNFPFFDRNVALLMQRSIKGFRVVTVAEGKKRLENLERVTRRAGGGGMFLFLNLDSDLLISGQPFWI